MASKDMIDGLNSKSFSLDYRRRWILLREVESEGAIRSGCDPSGDWKKNLKERGRTRVSEEIQPGWRDRDLGYFDLWHFVLSGILGLSDWSL